MTLVVILVLGLVVAAVGLIARLPADSQEHQPLIMRDGSQVVLPGGRRRLTTTPGAAMAARLSAEAGEKVRTRDAGAIGERAAREAPH